MNKRVSKSLKLQLLCAVLISFAAAFAVFALSFFLGGALLDRTVYGDTFSERMADQQFSLLQEYVEKEEISLSNLQRLNVWCSRGDKVYLTVYHDGVLIYESPFSGKTKAELNVQEYDPGMEDPDSKYILTLSGDVKARAFLYYYAGDAFYFWMTVLSGLFAFLSFSLCFVLLISRKVSYISQLSGELEILSGGQLDYPITVIGSDELGELATGIDQMRRSIMRHQEIEAQMRSANSELITAMSHDLRTPLTALLAYLELIERRKFADEEQLFELVHKSVRQTVRIRNMADKLFEYFLVYATDWEDAEKETADADALFGQILEEYTCSLESAGMKVERDFSPLCGSVEVNTELLQRAMDNLYSNLLKYADPEKCVFFSYKRRGGSLCLVISNGIASGSRLNESTKIGLNTCSRIIRYHGGSFSASKSEERFTVDISLPLKDS